MKKLVDIFKSPAATPAAATILGTIVGLVLAAIVVSKTEDIQEQDGVS